MDGRPLLGTAGFSGGIFLVYAGCGLLLLFGLDVVTDALYSQMARRWSQPNVPELFLQIAIGGVMLGFARKLAISR